MQSIKVAEVIQMPDIDEKVDALLEEKGKGAPPKQKRKLGIGEPVLLYVETSPGIYELYNRQFDSKLEADQFAEREFAGFRFKLYYLSEAKAEAEKIAKRQEQLQKAKTYVKEGAKKAASSAVGIGKSLLKASLREAEKEGLTKEQYEAKSRALDLKKQQAELRQTQTGQRPTRPQRPSFQPQPQAPQQRFRPQPGPTYMEEEYQEQQNYQSPPQQQRRPQPQTRFNPNPQPMRPSTRFTPNQGQQRGWRPPTTPFRQSSFTIPNKPYKPHFVGARPEEQVRRKKRK